MSSENNGGKTNYYDLPLPDKAKLIHLLTSVAYSQITIHDATEQILALCPQTLNDLIEYKQMKPWQHEVMKANYAINERAKKGEFASEEREINKIIYYANRGLNLVRKDK
jgi:hypothetical protein